MEKEKIVIILNDLDNLNKTLEAIYTLFEKVLFYYYANNQEFFYQVIGRYYLCFKTMCKDFNIEPYFGEEK